MVSINSKNLQFEEKFLQSKLKRLQEAIKHDINYLTYKKGSGVYKMTDEENIEKGKLAEHKKAKISKSKIKKTIKRFVKLIKNKEVLKTLEYLDVNVEMVISDEIFIEDQK